MASSSRAYGLFMTCAICACGPTLFVPGSGDSSGTDGAPTTPSTTGPATPPGTGSDTTGNAESTPDPDDSGGGDPDGGFIPFDDLGDDECDVFAQDCPPGEKCMPYSNDGVAGWNATGCFPVVEDPAGLHEACSVEGSGNSGLDTCDFGLMCWDVDPKTLEGSCVSLCSGDSSNPICEEPNTYCTISGDGAIVICLPTCDPLDPGDCPEAQACYPISNNFTCAPDASGEMGAPGDPCEYINVCDPGSACIQGELVPDCEGNFGCCSSYCNVEEVPRCLPGQVCLSWYEPGDAPPGNQNVGICGLET